jgi:primosomal protein N'
MLLADVLPLLRLPRHIARVFSYALPAGDHTYAVGDLVRMPFRGRLVYGVIVELRETDEPPKRLATVDGLAAVPVQFTGEELAWWKELSERTYVSFAQIAYASLPPWPRRTSRSERAAPAYPVGPVEPFTAAEEQEGATLLRGALQATPGTVWRVAHTHVRSQLAALAGCARQAPNTPMLILAPDTETAHAACGAIAPHARVHLWSGGLSGARARAAWQAWRTGHSWVVATRVATGTLPPRERTLWALRAGEGDYAQADQQPHWDARMLLDAHAARGGRSIATCLLPRVEDGPLNADLWQAPPHTVVDLRHAVRREPLWFVSEEAQEWLRAASADTPPVFLYWNRVEHDRFSATHIHRLLAQAYPHTPIHLLRPKNPIPESGIVVATSTFLHTMAFAPCKALAILVPFVDSEWAARGFRSTEQAARTVRTILAISERLGAHCLLQTKDPAFLTRLTESTTAFFAQEEEGRRPFRYPPFGHHTVRYENGQERERRWAEHPTVWQDWLTLPPESDMVVNPS